MLKQNQYNSKIIFDIWLYRLLSGLVFIAGEPASTTQEKKKGLMGTHFKRKRPRTMFTLYQLERMEGEFLRRQYITGNQRLQLASELQLSETQVRVWFQNRRIKWRKDVMKRQFDSY